jgi:23S rRNA (adenine2503-C2)-methyltransferase
MNILTEVKRKEFSNGVVYALKTQDGYLLETTDTFLPYYTKNAVGQHQNKLHNYDLGSREERYLIGVSCMSGCPVGCKFCATGQMKKFRNLTAEEIVAQIEFIISKNNQDPSESKEFKINYTRMGEPFLNIKEVKKAIEIINEKYPNVHHYISTIGVKNSDFSFVKGNITLQLSLHSLDEEKRNWLIPFKNKLAISELGQIRTNSNLKTTLNLTLVDSSDFDISKLCQCFDKNSFFIKLSPINENEISKQNGLGKGIIESVNLA